MAPKLFSKASKALHVLVEPTFPASSPVGPFSASPPQPPIIVLSFVPTTLACAGDSVGAGDTKTSKSGSSPLRRQSFSLVQHY